jgi:peptidoglycan/xylan/chitin deacetylase (PgdA/CDA1 family)
MKIPDPRVQPPGFIRGLFPGATWRYSASHPEVYLTFDDGPVPEATPWVLEILEKENCKATFFCVGENAVRHNSIYRKILEAGHTAGNHTYNHLQGLKTTDNEYVSNVIKASEVIDSRLFRPPHGIITPSQYRLLATRYSVVFWDIVSRDYHPEVSPERIFRNVKDYVRNGSVITFHDSVKTIQKLKIALPLVIKMLKDSGYHPVAIPDIGASYIPLHHETPGSFSGMA